jgi:hypothetical protein
MTTATTLYNSTRKYLLDSTVFLTTDTAKIALLAPTYDPAPGTPAWSGSVTYALGFLVKYDGRFHECITAGVSSALPPLFAAAGGTTVDNTVVWRAWGYAPPSPHTTYADVSAHELPATGGYSTGGITLTGVTVDLSLSSAIVKANSVTWSSALFSARYAAIYKSGTANAVVNPLVAYILLDDTNIDVGPAVTADFTIAWGATTGVFVFN